MRLLGITTEYNPFHNGHAYHIREAKARTGCDSVIALMSGDFVQRGLPASISKYIRARAALLNGADLVLELPVYSATASAERFADGAVRAFRDLGVDAISYGIESDTSASNAAQAIRNAAHFFLEESDAYQALLKEGLSKGQSYAAARWNAFLTLSKDAEAISSTPNNILAIEYEKAMLRHSVRFESVMVTRRGNAYHDSTAGIYASATGIRQVFADYRGAKGETSEAVLKSLSESVPANVLPLYESLLPYTVTADDLSTALFQSLYGKNADELAGYFDVSRELAARIASAAGAPYTWSTLAEQVKDRSHTRSHVDRALCHILLGITEGDEAKYRSAPSLPYLRVLGMKRSAAPLLSVLCERSAAPLLVRLAKDLSTLTPKSRALYDAELRATALYQSLLFSKGLTDTEERRRHFMIVEDTP